ncbi:MAG: glycosyltransferase family 2 protein [Acidimicrobiia bacterium]|nr:glycosyltransferase family 2 protein [Acidimicrobiia bacterium]
MAESGRWTSLLFGGLLLFVLSRLGRAMPKAGKAVPTATDDALAVGKRPSCILISSRNGGAQLASTVEAARGQCPVFVVSDGSTDNTAALAHAAGAEVLELTENIGKPAAIARALRHFEIDDRFETIAVIDDDTRLAPNFISECLRRMTAGVSIVVGKTMSDWSPAVRWNPWVAARAFGYWKYQLFIRRGQSALNVMNCISGSNSLYRTALLAQVASEQTPYIVDDTFWTLETHRRQLGRIVYAPRAVAWVQDPTTLRDWYRQNLRWLWGTMQGIAGHKIGRRATVFDAAYLGVILDWVLYVVLWPALLILGFFGPATGPLQLLAVYVAGYVAWAAIGAVFLRQWRLIPLAPALLAMDWIMRVNFVHALIKAVREPTTESCRWVSPARYQTQAA